MTHAFDRLTSDVLGVLAGITDDCLPNDDTRSAK